MSDFIANSNPPIFRPNPGFNPKGRQERQRRVYFYTLELGKQAAAQLRQTIAALRQTNEAYRFRLDEERFAAAVKELMCMWIHLEAVDQGGEGMPAWLMSYLKLALHASDQMIDEPLALDIMRQHQLCNELDLLYNEAAATIAKHLGFAGADAAFVPLLTNSRAMRQAILKESLLLEPDDV